MMEHSYIQENDASRERLRSLVESLSDQDMARPLGQHWTVGVGLCHLAFWDRQWLFKFQEWERTGSVFIPEVARQIDLVGALNDGMLPWWQSISPAQVRFEVLSAAEAVDAYASKLDRAVLDAIFAQRPRTLIRAVHRNDHLTEIEASLGR